MEPLGKKKKKKCWLTASGWKFYAMFQSRARRCLDLFFFFWSKLFLRLLSDSVVFLAVLQCFAIWVGGSFCSASWASVHNIKTILQSCPLEIRSSAMLESIQITIVIVRTKPLHFGSGFVPQNSIVNTIF